MCSGVSVGKSVPPVPLTPHMAGQSATEDYEPPLFQAAVAARSWQNFTASVQTVIKQNDGQTKFEFQDELKKNLCLVLEFFKEESGLQSLQSGDDIPQEICDFCEEILPTVQTFIQNNNDLHFKIQIYSYQKKILPIVLSLCLFGALFLCGWQIGLLPAFAALVCKVGVFTSFGIAGALVLANSVLMRHFPYEELSAELKQFEEKQGQDFRKNAGMLNFSEEQLQKFKESILAEYKSKNPDTSDEARFLIAQNFGILAEILKNGHDDPSSG